MEAPAEFYLIINAEGQIIATHSKLGEVGENSALQKQCEIYYDQIGVEGYKDYVDFTIWLLNGEWYTDNQISRMLRLKAFS
jgi:hypothetical protein